MGGCPEVLMDHHYIEEHNIPDRYLLGKLHAEERAQFEAHFIDCRECLDRLETTEDFGGALRSVAAEEVARGYATAGLLTRVSAAQPWQASGSDAGGDPAAGCGAGGFIDQGWRPLAR